jgi:hypothetical protein
MQHYACRGAFNVRSAMSCNSFGGLRVDLAIAQGFWNEISDSASRLLCPNPKRYSCIY